MTEADFKLKCSELYKEVSKAAQRFPNTLCELQEQNNKRCTILIRSMSMRSAVYYVWLDKDNQPTWGYHLI